MVKLSQYNTLYVVERWFENDSFIVTKQGGEVSARPDGLFDRVPDQLFEGLADCSFRVVGSVVQVDAMSMFFVEDVLYFNGKKFTSEPWSERYKVLLNGFDWSTSVRRVNPVAVSDAEELRGACRVVSKLPGSKGAHIRDYGARLDENGWVVPAEEVLSGAEAAGDA